MTDIRVVVLDNDKHIICRLAEVRDDNDKAVCLVMDYPFVLSLPDKIDDEEGLKIKFTLWSPYTKDIEYRVPYSKVVTIGFPKEQIEEKYIQMIKPFEPNIDKTSDQIIKGEIEE